MSLIKVNSIIHPTGTANNITLDNAGNVIIPRGTVTALVQGTAQNTTSGTSIDFTGIPSWVKRITVMFSGVSGSGTSNHLIQLGTASGIETTGYVSSCLILATSPGTNNNGNNYTTGFGIYLDNVTYTYSGAMTLLNVSGNLWVSSFTMGLSSVTPSFTGLTNFGGGNKTLGGILTRIRLTTVNGTDTFDAGSVNILYE